jgi:4-hydroxy-4-methyl-2-oxoglutarate aldolase
MAGAVNVPVVCAGELVRPGDVIVADVDGVCVVRRERATEINELALAKLKSEEHIREIVRSGGLSMDHDGGRAKLAELGVEYVESE